MAATINDIAKKVGVSPSTVSRVMTGNAKISEETKDRIFAAMDELDYHPNSIARNLANGSSRTISLILDVAAQDSAFSNIFFSRSIAGIEKSTQLKEYSLLISGLRSGSLEKTVRNLFLEHKADGLVIPSSLLDRKSADFLNKKKYPFVVLGEPTIDLVDCDWVDINNSQGSEIAVNHLIDKGYGHIAFFGGNGADLFNKYRVKGYRKAIERISGEECIYVVETSSDRNEMYKAALDFLGKRSCDAVITNDNISAYCILKAANELGLNVPSDLGIVTFDNYPLAEYLEPQLTSLDIDTAVQGEMAGNILMNKIEDKSALTQQSLISVKLMERDSSRRN